MLRNVLVAITVVAVSPQAEAFAVDYKFSATVQSVDTPISSQFQVGEIVSGHFSLAPANADSDSAIYAVSNFSANIGGNYPLTSGGGSFSVLNNFGDDIDQVKLDIATPNGLSGQTVAGHVPEYFSFNLLYNVTDLSSTNLLPQFVIDSPLDRSNLRFDGNDSIEVKFTLTDVSPVPEPSTLILAALGTLALLAYRPVAP